MGLWQWAWAWVWLVGLGTIKTGGKLSWEQWGGGSLGGEGSICLRSWEAKQGPSSPSTCLSHPPHPAWAFAWRAQPILEKFLEQNQAPPQHTKAVWPDRVLGRLQPLGVEGRGLLDS